MAGNIFSQTQSAIILTRQMLKEQYKLKNPKNIQIPQEVTEVLFKFANSEVVKIYIDSTLKCSQLKTLVYKYLSQTLQPQHMIFTFKNKRIREDQILGDILTLNDLIVQEKLPLKEVPNIQYQSKVQDDFTLQMGVAKTSCGHKIGRDSIIQFIKGVINDQKHKLICPHPRCEAEWTLQQCKMIGGFTREQEKEFKQSLKFNWIKKNSVECPDCHTLVLAQDKSKKMIICTNKKCKTKIFCRLCSKKWKDELKIQCGNVECNFSTFYNQTKTKPFKFWDSQKTQFISVDIPTHRLCPSCKASIEHGQGCKHMECPSCKTTFCFVCLDVLQKNWKCGGFNQFCGQVAGRQPLL